MSDVSRPCLKGCTRRGEHKPDCTGKCPHTACRSTCDGTCPGCAPRDAEPGLNLCAWCWQRLQSDIATTPALIAHLRAVGEPEAQIAPPSDTRAYRDGNGNLIPAAWAAADEIHAMLASWAHLVLEEHPQGHQWRGPDERDTWRTETVAVLDTDIAHEYGPYLRKSQVAGVRDPDATARLVRWLMPHLEWCAAQEWAGEIRQDVAEATSTALARWPMQDTRPRHVVGVRCARCARESLEYTPTAGYLLPFHVKCTNPECGRVYTEAEWDAAIAKATIRRGYVA